MPPLVKKRKFTRRRFFAAAILGAPLLATVDAKWLEPGWVKVRRVRLGAGNAPPRHRFVQFSDVHHKGDRAYLEGVIRKINQLSPEFVCFTGDLIEEGKYLEDALKIFAGIKAPVYGVPGNHDYWSKVPFDGITRCLTATGGAWLVDEATVTADGQFTLHGAAGLGRRQEPLKLSASTRNIFLVHYPAWVKRLGTERFDLILAGHSHGGQVRLPIYGALMLPFGVDEYDLGLFRTRSGPLYVNAGIGWFPVPVRFNCRPEITVFEL